VVLEFKAYSFHSGVVHFFYIRALCLKLCGRFNIIKTETFYDIQYIYWQMRVKPVNNHLFFTGHGIWDFIKDCNDS